MKGGTTNLTRIEFDISMATNFTSIAFIKSKWFKTSDIKERRIHTLHYFTQTVGNSIQLNLSDILSYKCQIQIQFDVFL